MPHIVERQKITTTITVTSWHNLYHRHRRRRCRRWLPTYHRIHDGLHSTALDEMQSYVNLTHGTNIQLKGERCGSKLLLHQRGSSLIASSFQVHFFAEQVGGRLIIVLCAAVVLIRTIDPRKAMMQCWGGTCGVFTDQEDS